MDRCATLGIKPSNRVLLIDIATQTLRLCEADSPRRTFVISTSRRPPSNVEGSLGTPPGLHAIAEKIGAGQPPGIVFRHRVATGYHFNEHIARGGTDENLITTRILWLKGLEPGVNLGGTVDTYKRYIYIHGTNHEDRLGQPQSGGCVLMHNVELIELFELVRVGDVVWIGD